MSKPLEELHAQRDLIQQHLNWLDAQIASAEGSAEPSTRPVEPSVASSASADAPIATTVKTPTTTAAATAAVKKIVLEASANPEAPVLPIDEAHHLASGTSDIKRAQIGCFLFFVGAILLFLFFLFGLPYLID